MYEARYEGLPNVPPGRSLPITKKSEGEIRCRIAVAATAVLIQKCQRTIRTISPSPFRISEANMRYQRYKCQRPITPIARSCTDQKLRSGLTPMIEAMVRTVSKPSRTVLRFVKRGRYRGAILMSASQIKPTSPTKIVKLATFSVIKG